jgi:hypothetical protein
MKAAVDNCQQVTAADPAQHAPRPAASKGNGCSRLLALRLLLQLRWCCCRGRQLLLLPWPWHRRLRQAHQLSQRRGKQDMGGLQLWWRQRLGLDVWRLFCLRLPQLRRQQPRELLCQHLQQLLRKLRGIVLHAVITSVVHLLLLLLRLLLLRWLLLQWFLLLLGSLAHVITALCSSCARARTADRTRL